VARRRVTAIGSKGEALLRAEDVEVRVTGAARQFQPRGSRFRLEGRGGLGHYGRNHFMAKAPLGKLKPTAIGMTEPPRLDAGILAGFRSLGDLTGTTSDALDECGIAGAVPASVLKPTEPSARVIGQAITVLNRKSAEMRKLSGLADIEAHNLAQPGDVL